MASPITTHVLDISLGRPAEGVDVRLFREAESDPTGLGTTDSDGRVTDLVGGSLEDGVYRLRFQTGAYFEAQGRDAFYPWVEVSFRVIAGERYHVPLLLSPFGYSTYRGS